MIILFSFLLFSFAKSQPLCDWLCPLSNKRENWFCSGLCTNVQTYVDEMSILYTLNSELERSLLKETAHNILLIQGTPSCECSTLNPESRIPTETHMNVKLQFLNCQHNLDILQYEHIETELGLNECIISNSDMTYHYQLLNEKIIKVTKVYRLLLFILFLVSIAIVI
jgi:hypothetical protein